MAKSKTGEPWIWLQNTEEDGQAECGCTMIRDWDGDPAFFPCPLHDAAPRLLRACKAAEDLLSELADGGAENPELDILKAAIAKAEGK